MHLIPPAQVERIALLGTGAIGASWAALFIAQGKQVTAFDPDPTAPQRVERFIARALPVLEQIGQVRKSTQHSPINFCSSPAIAVRDAQFIQECGPENLDAKRELYKQLDDALAPTAGRSIEQLERDRDAKLLALLRARSKDSI
jgi:carnitine 3-dehydrogenase